MGCTLILSCCLLKYHMVSLLQFTFLQLFLEYPSMFSFTYPLSRIDLWMLRFVGHAYLDRVVTSMDQGTKSWFYPKVMILVFIWDSDFLL